MLKISPITKNNQCIKKIQNQKNKVLPASLLVLSMLSGVATNSCSKIVLEEKKDVFEKIDTTKTEDDDKKKSVDVIIDDSLDVIEHIIVI